MSDIAEPPAPPPDSPAPAPIPAPSGNGPDSQAAGGDIPARPEFIPEKFWKDGKPDVENMAKSYAALETKLGKSAGEVPDAPEGYTLKPEKLPDGIQFNEDAAKQFATAFHNAGVTKEQAGKITDVWFQMEKANHDAMAAAYQESLTKGTEALKKEWGSGYAEKIGKVKSVVQSLGYDPTDATLFSNPTVVKFLGKVTGLLSEDAVASMRGAVAPGSSFVSPTEEAHAIMTDDKHPEHRKYMEGDRNVVKKVARLLGD